MDPERWRRIERLYSSALELKSDQRESYLNEACAADLSLRKEVERLLERQSEAEAFIESPAIELAAKQLAAEPSVGSPSRLDSPPWAPAAGQHLGPYEVIGLLGAGGMGEVYKARDTRLNRTVAVKVLSGASVLDPAARDRFTREAQAIAALDHPHICTLYDVGREGDIDYLVMEHLEGETLARRLEKRPGGRQAPPLGIEEVLAIGVQIAEALAAAHRQGIVHRDLKPGNVMLTMTGAVRPGAPQVKLLDFGLAKLRRPTDESGISLSAAATHEPTTKPGAVIGTLPYMAPEQLEGREVDARADLFAFGCVLYEMLTLRRAFAGETGASVISAIMTKEPPPVSTLQPVTPPALDRLVTGCLAKNPDDRRQTAREVADELRLIAAQAGADGRAVRDGAVPAASGSERPPSVLGRLLASMHAHRWFWLLSSLIVLATFLATTLAWLELGPAPRPPVAAGSPSVLALPCKVYGAPEVAFLTDAVPQTISTLLAQVDGLETRVPPSSLEVDKVNGDLSRLSELYRVTSFIVTSLTASAGRFALNVQLVDAVTQRVRWGRQYEGPRDSYNELARNAAEGIRLAIKPAAAPVQAAKVSSEAELAYREGTYFLSRYIAVARQSNFDAALAAYLRALALDPSFAVAAAKVSFLYTIRIDVAGDSDVASKDAELWARRAISIDPRCGEAWVALHWVDIYATRANPEKGLEYVLKGIAFAPLDAAAHSGIGWRSGYPGSLALFAAANLRAYDLDPLFFAAAVNTATRLADLGRSKEALQLIDRALRVEPELFWVVMMRAHVLLKLGRLEEAERALQSSRAQATAEHTLGALWRQISLAAAVARRDTAMSDTLARQVVASALDTRMNALLVANAISAAAPLARMGRNDDAVRILLRSVEAGVPPPYDFVLRDPDIQRLRGDPRFAKVLAASRDGAAMVARVLGQARARGELPAYLHVPLDELVQLLKENEGR